MHYLNNLLPPAERDGICSDSEASDAAVRSLLVTLKESVHNNTITSKDIGFCVLKISCHCDLQYELSVDSRREAVTTLLSVYKHEFTRLSMKTRILGILTKLCKKSLPKINDLNLDWQFFWSEIITIVQRESGQHAVSSHSVSAKHLEKLISFTHSVRQYFSSSAEVIISIAMKELEDVRIPTCVKGVLLLITCLPTACPSSLYDAHLQKWVTLWGSITHNSYWDCCWLTLLTRARKYSNPHGPFPWSALTPLLLTKAKELMQLPSADNGKTNAPQNAEFPHTFPSQYIKLLTIQTDAKKAALNKLAKLFYFLTCQCDVAVPAEMIIVTAPSLMQASSVPIVGFNQPPAVPVKQVSVDLVLLLQSIRPFLYPSNTGTWTVQLGFFMATFVVQMTRHLGRSIADALVGSAIDELSPVALPFHLATVQYLSGSLLALLVEGLYGKNAMMSHCCAVSLKSIMAIDPNIGDVLVPFFLSSLDVAAVNQSHQAPVAMSTLKLCYKTLLYPKPIILKYLPDLLRLSLPGLDPSDVSKTVVTLQLYSTILTWLPVKSVYVANKSSDYPPSHIALIDPAFKEFNPFSEEDCQREFDNLSSYLPEWSASMLDRVFLLLEAQETAVKNAPESPVVSLIAQCIAFFFQAAPRGDAIRVKAEEKILDYFTKSTPLNATKVSAKIIESVVCTNPSILPRFLKSILNKEVLSVSYSTEKIAFRIRLAAGACKQAGSVALTEELKGDLLQSIYNSQTFLRHSEKSVRKESRKLVKNMLKCVTAFYPVFIQPLAFEGQPLGATNSFDTTNVTWNIPDASTLSTAVALLRGTLGTAMEEIQAALSDINTQQPLPGQVDAGSSKTTQQAVVKKCEDTIVFGLTMISKCLRGAAEILGDSTTTGVNAGNKLLSTGRAEAINGLPEQDRQYILELRVKVLHLLDGVYVTLYGISPENSFYGLRSSTDIHKTWMKVLSLVVTRRMSFLKDVGQTKKYLEHSKRVGRGSVTKAVFKTLKYRQVHAIATSGSRSAVSDVLKTVQYWQGHDLSTNHIACVAWLQHATRLQELSYNVIEANVDGLNPQDPYMVCLNHLVEMCGHEYDIIRWKGLKIFDKTAPHFTRKVLPILKSLLGSLTQPNEQVVAAGSGAVYAKLLSALSLISQKKMLGRIEAEWDLAGPFLKALTTCQANITLLVSEADKREKLIHKVAEVFVKYSESWCHPTAAADDFCAALINSSLAIAGGGVRPDLTASDSSDNSPAVSSGLRFETFAAYILLHFIGYRNFSPTPSMWKWAINSICFNAGQPSQRIGLAALVRLSYLATISELDSAVRAVTESQLNPLSTTSTWTALLKGISQCHQKSSDDGSSAQWSQGIDKILSSASSLKSVMPRLFVSVSDSNSFSSHFNKNDAGLHYSFFISQVILPPTDENGRDRNTLTVDVVTKLFSIASSMTSTSEIEARANNTTSAELFAGLLRASRHTTPTTKKAPSSHWDPLLQQCFLDFFVKNVEKVSVEFSSDWAEALMFAYYGNPIAIDESGLSDDLIVSHVYEAFKLIFTSSSVAASESDESFSKQGKLLSFVRALLKADKLSSGLVGVESSLARAILQTLKSSGVNIVSPYSTTRAEVASILCMLCDVSDAQSGDLLSICDTLASVAKTAVDDSPMAVDFPEVTTTVSLSAVLEQQVQDDSSSSSSSNKVALTASKNAVETSYTWVSRLVHRVPMARCSAVALKLLSILLAGSGHPDIDTAKISHSICLFMSKALIINQFQGAADDLVADVIRLFHSQCQHESWHVRETVMMCLTIVMVNNWSILSADSKKTCKLAFEQGMIQDGKPEVQHLAKAGMVSYLSMKPSKELKIVAEAYIKNSEALADREKKRRKLASAAAGDGKPDAIHTTTIMMMSCLVLSLPYDLPEYLPALLTTLLRHGTMNSFKDTVTKTVQMFKLTHQDRWNEFKLSFSREQLEDLQGAGAAHYFS